MRHREWIFAVLLWQLSVPGLAAEELPSALETCRAEKNDSRRLSCYDRVVDAAPPESGSTPATPQEKFGYAGMRARKEQSAEQKDAARLSELVAKVTEVSKRPNGTHVITLDNGQVWVEKTLEPFLRISVGDEVTIRPAVLGTFLLSTPGSRSTRVTRTK